MKQPLFRIQAGLFLVLFGLAPLVGHAQSAACMLVPVPLAQRTQQAALVVEARVIAQQVVQTIDGHFATRNTLEIYKLFRGQLPAGPLSVLTQGGTLGLRREEVTGTLQLQPGQEGIFMLEADPTVPGELRAYAGPQGFIEYNLTNLTASEPFGHYASIAGALYNAVVARTGTPYRNVATNTSLRAATQRLSQRATAKTLAATAPIISSFSPKIVTAGTSTSTSTSATGVLTITGAGFGATQGTGFVQFPNADNGGGTCTHPLASDYLSWSDTQIEVRVPSKSATDNTAGTGPFQVALDNTGTLVATSPSVLTVTYSLINAASGDQTYRVHLISPDVSGGYTLQYASSFPAEAKAPFERALQNWHCQTSMNRTIGAGTASDVTAANSVNVVRFAGTSELTTGVLGVTHSYYIGCSVNNGPINFQLTETDYVYTPVPIPASGNNPAYTWNFGPGTPTSTQYDFESVALHEQGHGEQLTHIISATGVMNYAIANGDTRRTLDANIDILAGQNVIGYSTSAPAAERCSSAAFVASSCPLPVQLTAFTARYQPGRGTLLNWATATELNSASFITESQEDIRNSPWQELTRVAAAGSSATPRQYQARDARPLAGTRYYRLRQVDLDGTVTYSPVVRVAAVATELIAYPNPATGLVQLDGPLAAGTTAQVRLLDTTGRCLLRAAGPAGQTAFALPLTGVPAGLYLLEWDGGAGLSHLRLVVQ